MRWLSFTPHLLEAKWTPQAIVRLEGLGKLKNSVTSLGTFRLCGIIIPGPISSFVMVWHGCNFTSICATAEQYIVTFERLYLNYSRFGSMLNPQLAL
jgi:hypothetical protein